MSICTELKMHFEWLFIEVKLMIWAYLVPLNYIILHVALGIVITMEYL